jgi:hypothetical protein
MKNKTITPQDIEASGMGPVPITDDADLILFDIGESQSAAMPQSAEPAIDQIARYVLVSKHFAERTESRDVPSELVLKRMLRAAIKAIVEQQHEDPLYSYFVVTESPVELTDVAGELVKGYAGVPLIWTSPKRSDDNWAEVERALKRAGKATESTKLTIIIATDCMAKALTYGEPVNLRPEDVHVPIKAANVVLNDKPGTLTEGQQLALAHVLAADLERNLTEMQTPFEAVASGFYGYIDHHSFSGSSDGNTLNIPQFYCNGLIFV